MSRPNIMRPPHPAVPIATHAMWLITSTAVIGQLVGALPAEAASAPEPLLAGEQALAEGELAELRGGFVTKEGLEISFGFQIDLDLDDRLALSMQFDPWSGNGDRDRDRMAKSRGEPKSPRAPKSPKSPKAPKAPKAPHGSQASKAKGHEGGSAKASKAGWHDQGSAKGKPGSQATLANREGLFGDLRLTIEDKTAGRDEAGAPPLAELDLHRDRGAAVLSGAPEVTEIEGGSRFAFADDVVADVTRSAGDLTVEARVGNDLPVRVVRTAQGVDLEVGDETTGTRIVDHISPNLVASRSVNRLDGADVDHQVRFDINLLNFSDLAAARKPYQNGRRVQRLVDRGLVQMLTRR